MGTSRLSGGGVFSRRDGELADFVSDVGQDSGIGDRRFVGRNFLLDEGVLDLRADSYESEGGAARHADVHAWEHRHNEYLRQRVFLDQPVSGPPGTLNPARPAGCPETFRFPEGLTFATARTDLDLLRVVNARRVAKFARRDESELLAWAHEVLANKDRTAAAWLELSSALGFWSSRRQLRPVYATFWEDHRDLFENDRPDWADVLRDRLGLLHYSPGAGRELSILVFRYPIREVPKHVQVRLGRPLAAPTVLDAELSEAFCPAPRGEVCGRVLDLSAPFEEPSREVVHPFLPYRVEHLFQVGTVRRAVPPSLVEARKAHLLAIQVLCSRPDYAAGTDGDLLT